ncbi:MAG: hypothetical protein KVP17_001107 [Porospora cf. gigantea B]|uniref:uncharacterized protein n=1 Tax=Porospora cf. gigantea B TaxID=2853592 RepID=UPI003571C622|nr:MAG: hypothetical protein KVP17_001107 [Porospora cf. gigantea B]
MTNSSKPKGRVLLQQCLGAELRTGDTNVRIDRGVVAFVCFMRGADSTTVNRMAKSIVNASLSETTDGFKSVVDLPGDILVVPQATLGGKSKGKAVQYHNNAPKADADAIYCAFVKTLTDLVPGTRVEHGSFGERQVLAMDNTCGPFSHLFDVE